jgi:hypothetical protein
MNLQFKPGRVIVPNRRLAYGHLSSEQGLVLCCGGKRVRGLPRVDWIEYDVTDEQAHVIARLAAAGFHPDDSDDRGCRFWRSDDPELSYSLDEALELCAVTPL